MLLQLLTALQLVITSVLIFVILFLRWWPSLAGVQDGPTRKSAKGGKRAKDEEATVGDSSSADTED